MSYKQNLAKLHSDRMARLWPVQQNAEHQKLIARATSLKAEIAGLEARRDRIQAVIRELDNRLVEVRGEAPLIALRDRICAEHEIPVDAFVGRGASQLLIIARRQFAQEARAMGIGYVRIGYHIGGRDHSTVLNYINPKTLRSNSWAPAGKRYARKPKDVIPMVG